MAPFFVSILIEEVAVEQSRKKHCDNSRVVVADY